MNKSKEVRQTDAFPQTRRSFLALAGFSAASLAAIPVKAQIQNTLKKNPDIDREVLEDRILGSIFGASIGDSVGGAFEFQYREQIEATLGTDWIDEMYDYPDLALPYYVWTKKASAGTGTDDTRMVQIFIEAVIENKGVITPQRLAIEYIRRYLHPERYYPERMLSMARSHWKDYYGVSCGCLNMECPELPGVPVHALQQRSFGVRYPSLVGMLSLVNAGCLYVNEPVEAYKKAYELAYLDVSYAKEASGLYAAAISMAIGGKDMGEIVSTLHDLDPYKFRESTMGSFGDKMLWATSTAPKLAEKAKDSRDLVVQLSKEVQDLHVFDPADMLVVSLAANMFAADDPKEAILIAANHRNVDDNGKMIRFRDNDCTGTLTGALAGALVGYKKLPTAWVNKVLENNKKEYSIDILKNAHNFCNAIYGES